MSSTPNEIIRAEGSAPEPVDMVIYFGTERVVVGKAGINPDGTFVAKFSDKIDTRAADILTYVKGEFSFGLPRILKPRFQSEFTAGDLPFDGNVSNDPDKLIISKG